MIEMKHKWTAMLVAMCALFIAGAPLHATSKVDYKSAADYIHEWNQIYTKIIMEDGFTPGAAARNYSYGNIAAYEAAAPGFKECRSLAGQLNGLSPVPKPEAGKEYDWRVAAIVAYTSMAPKLMFRFYISDSACDAQLKEIAASGVPQDVIKRSEEYGITVANHIIKWMKDDGFLAMQAKPQYTIPIYEGAWEPTPPNFAPPVDPYWNTHRPFIMEAADQFKPKPPYEFSTDPSSAFYKDAMDVYELSKKLSDEQKLIARFWDCNPIHSYFRGHFRFNSRQISPGGHWISITGVVCKDKGLDMMQALETYVRVACATADGFISSWDAKYKTNVIRPVTYINKYIDPEWEPYIETPPFPEYTSAHSTISAAAASVLTHIFGDDVAFKDITEMYLGLPMREFKSFREAAMEVTWSRVYGGIHYRTACLSGTEAGWKIGDYAYEKLQTRYASK